MSREELRHELLSDLDRALSHTWVVSAREQALLRAVRSLVLADDALVDKIGALMTNHLAQMEEEDVAKKKNGAAAPAKAIDWTKIRELVQQYGPVVEQAIIGLLTLFAGGAQAAPKAASCGPDGCTDLKDLLDCVIQCNIHSLASAIQARQCQDGPVPTPEPAPPA